MDDESSDQSHASERLVGERERALMEHSISAYGRHLRAMARFQKAAVEFRQAKEQHERLHATLKELAIAREEAAVRRQQVRDAVCDYVRALRDDERAPETVLTMTKRAMRSIVVRMPANESLLNPEPLLEEAVRWAILAYYDAA